MSTTKIRPIEDLLLTGVEKRFQQVFGCPVLVTNSYEKTRALEHLLGGKPVTYPYAFLRHTSLARTTNSYNARSFARRGVQAILQDSNNAAYTVRLLPTDFTLEFEYITDQYDLQNEKSVLSFARRWLFAGTNGYLKFDIDYGRLSLNIGATLDENIQIPERGNLVEQVSSYTVTGSYTVHGWVSEPELGTTGVVNEVEMATSIGAPQAILDRPTPTQSFWAFQGEKYGSNR